ncbi:MAG: hypothetical protein AB7O65_13100, partial [Candidatus Korobacteraceae bacterium]
RMELSISYRAVGADATGNDRGRTLGTLDAELLRVCQPPRTPKLDYTQAEPALLGSMVLWGIPQFEAAKSIGGELRRTAHLSVFYFPEPEVA